VSISTGNNCLDALFTKERFDRLEQSDAAFLKWLCGQGQYWFTREMEVFGHDGIYKWDVYAAAALICPELFIENSVEISPDLESMKSGMLLGQGETFTVNLPLLKDSASYIEHVYDVYAQFATH